MVVGPTTDLYPDSRPEGLGLAPAPRNSYEDKAVRKMNDDQSCMTIFIYGSKSSSVQEDQSICLSNKTKGHGLSLMKRECFFINGEACRQEHLSCRSPHKRGKPASPLHCMGTHGECCEIVINKLVITLDYRL